jgi:CheY-like chemotaxis protein
VLVVEDDEAARELLTTYLRQAGYRVAGVTNGMNVVEQVRALRPAAITLDVMLPGCDGWEVLQALKADPATADVPVVIVSVVDNEHLGYALGAAAYLVKPISQSDLLRTLERVCPASRPAMAGERAGAPPTALVVDDEARARELVSAFLEPAGFRVLEAPGGEAGVALAAERRPDVILLDLMMPGVSGFEVVERLKAAPTTRDIPIVILTAKDLTAADRAALNGQIATVMAKASVTRERFLAELARVLEPAALTAGATGESREDAR